MRVALLCPPASLSPPVVRPRHAPHLTAIVAAALQRAGHDVEVLDEQLRSTCLKTSCDRLEAVRPDLVLLMHSDYNRRIADDVLEAAVSAVQLRLPEVPLWGYGRLALNDAKQAMEAVPSLSGLLFDEPEFPAVGLAAALEEGETTEAIPATIHRGESGELVVLAPDAVDLSDSPVPAWDLVDIQSYAFSPHQQVEDPVVPVLASRGCPFPCFYCEVRARPGWRARSVDSVLAELQTLRARWGVNSVFIADPTFGVDREWAMEFCRRLPVEGPKGIRWSCMSRTDRVDSELLQAMSDAGCWNILFGVESLNPEALRQASKNLDPTTVAPAIRAAQEAGLEVIASIMIGLPGDTPEGVERTLDGLVEMEPDFAQFFVVQITEDQVPEGGRLVSEWDGSRYDFWGHVYAPDGFESKEQLLHLRRRAYRRFYLRPRYMRKRLVRMLRSGEVRAQFKRAFHGGLLAVRLAAGQRPTA